MKGSSVASGAITSTGRPAVCTRRPWWVSNISVRPCHSLKPTPRPGLTSSASATPRLASSTGASMASTWAMLICDSGPNTAMCRVSSASPVKELHPARPIKATPSATRCRKVFTGSSSVVASYFVFCTSTGIENGSGRYQLADYAVPAGNAGGTHEHHVLGLHLELIGQQEGRRRFGVELEDGGRFGLDVLDTADYIHFLAAGAQGRRPADSTQHLAQRHAASAVGQSTWSGYFTHDQHLAGVVQPHVYLVTRLEVHLTDTAGRCGQAVVIQAIGLAIPGDGQVGQIRALGVNTCLPDGLQQSQALGVNGKNACILEGATEVDLLAVVLDNVHVNLGLLDIARQASSDDFTQLFQGLAGNLHITDKGVEQSPIVPHNPSVSAGRLLLAAGNRQFRVIPHSDEKRVVWPDAVVLGHITQQLRGHLSLGFDGQILRDQLWGDLHHLHHAVLCGVLANQTISIHVHARSEHTGLKKEGRNAKGDKRESGHGWHSSILVIIKKAT